jgi:hypothetical protein
VNAHSSDLAQQGFAAMERGDYDNGISLWRRAAGAEHIEFMGSYDPAAAHMVFHRFKRAASSDPAAAAVVGLYNEHEGDRQRTTGKSPNYVSGGQFVNYYGQAILWYRKAVEGGNGCARQRLVALEKKLGKTQFRDVEQEDLRMRENMRANVHQAQQILRGDAPRSEWPTSLASEPPQRQQRASKSTSDGGGCYIATAVYGSYSEPPVRTLRRFRDETLVASLAGRAAIRFYYWVSPRAARHFRQGTMANLVARNVLDLLVRRLDNAHAANDYGDTEEAAREEH